MNVTTDQLKRFFSGRYSARDYRRVHEGFSDGKQVKESMEQHWMEYEPDENEEDDDRIGRLLDRVRYRIHLEEDRRNDRPGFMLLLRTVAAALFLPVLLSFVIYLFLDQNRTAVKGYAEIMSPMGGKTRFVLPDGSQGFLNSGSTLGYNVAFNENRTVKLRGEAYFDVVHTGVPFHVLTQKLDVKVIGTTFNVTAYEDDRAEEIILKSGQVQVSLSGGDELAILKPDQQLIFNKRFLDFQLKDVDASQFTAWTEGRLVFRNETLDRVAERLNRWYNVEIKIQDPELNAYTFHATFLDEPLDQVLKLLSMTTPISYTEAERSFTAGGQLVEHRKITLKLDKEKVNMFQ